MNGVRKMRISRESEGIHDKGRRASQCMGKQRIDGKSSRKAAKGGNQGRMGPSFRGHLVHLQLESARNLYSCQFVFF